MLKLRGVTIFPAKEKNCLNERKKLHQYIGALMNKPCSRKKTKKNEPASELNKNHNSYLKFTRIMHCMLHFWIFLDAFFLLFFFWFSIFCFFFLNIWAFIHLKKLLFLLLKYQKYPCHLNIYLDKYFVD